MWWLFYGGRPPAFLKEEKDVQKKKQKQKTKKQNVEYVVVV